MQGKSGEQLSEHQAKSGSELKLPVVGLNDNLVFMGRQLHVQTEHTGFPVARIVTQVFCSGRVLLSKKRNALRAFMNLRISTSFKS